MKYDIVLMKKPYVQGLEKRETLLLLDLLEDDVEVFPIEIEDPIAECSAMGFITADIARTLDYDYKNSGLKDFVIVAMECGGTDFNFNGMKVCVLK